LPFGISIAPEIFHRAVVDALAGIPGVEVFIDDIFIRGKDDAEHDERFDLVLQRLVENQFTPNLAKIQKKQRKVKFLGHVIGEGQVEPDPDKIRALLEAPEPTSRKDLKSFTGALAWNRKYIPNIHELFAPFRDLMKERTPWRWEKNHAEAFNAIKTKMRAILPLMNIRNGESMILGTDASSYGLGACLTQKDENGEERPIFFASRMMTEAELKWAQVDKELLAIVWGFERLDNYVYGRKVRVRSDHKPLLGLIKKPLSHLSTRQQRLMARLMRYDLEIEYCPGKDLIVPDFLSRAVTNEDKACRCQFLGTDLEVEETFVSMVTAVQVSKELESLVRENATKDTAYGHALKAYLNAWPESMKHDCGEYWSNREDLVAEDNLLFFQGRLVVPTGARSRMLTSLHRGHVGCKAARKRAEKAVWWPGWTVSIKEHRDACGQCQVMKPAQQKEPMLSFKVPPAPGLVWHSDYLTWNGQDYVFFVDGFSGWTELYTATSRCPTTLIRIMRLQLMRQGIPRTIQADQGTAYHSREFKEFCEKYGINLVLSSPKHSQGNAVAEATVKKIKHLFKGAQDEDELTCAVLAMNQTPVTSGRPSPAEIHFGRNLRDELHDTVRQTEVTWAEVQGWKEQEQLANKRWYDKGARELGELRGEDEVHVWHKEQWRKAKVKEKVVERPRSYKVELENGRMLERNRVLIRKKRWGDVTEE
jgi:transposase InsO family protein